MVKNLLTQLKKSPADAIKTASKRAIQKTAEATGYLVGTKIANKSTCASKKSRNEEIQSNEVNDEIPKRDVFLQKKGNKLLMN